MTVTVGTFNLNNLFSRFNFTAAVTETPSALSGGVKLTFDEGDIRVRTFLGRLVKAKDHGETETIANRIKAMDVDVLAVQEVEHIGILRQFNRDFLGGLYDHVALIEGNDPRLIDVGLLSKLPLGAITSHQTATHPDDPGRRVSGATCWRRRCSRRAGRACSRSTTPISKAISCPSASTRSRAPGGECAAAAPGGDGEAHPRPTANARTAGSSSSAT
jgi:hypothetical protein